MSKLFSPFVLRDTTFANRLWVSPMCQYSATEGVPNEWHLVHLGSRAIGGAGLVMAEATAVTPEGRISPQDTGIWNDEQAHSWERIAGFLRWHGSLPGIQLAHAGRKASTYAPWKGNGSVPRQEGGWPTIAPSDVAFQGYAAPTAMGDADLARVKGAFVAAAERALQVGFEVIELHAAHGYLHHQFLSPLSNLRTDEYGGTFEGRTRYLLETVDAVREVWPNRLPLFVRISATDWADGGWSLEESVELSRLLGIRGVDLIDVSSAGLVADAKIVVGPGYQVGFAEEIRRKTGLATAAVGMIDSAWQAEHVLEAGSADAVFVARQFLRDPYFPMHAAAEMGDDFAWPVQYARAKPRH